jgi:hypothetical protein
MKYFRFITLFLSLLLTCFLGLMTSVAPAREPAMKLVHVDDDHFWYINTDTLTRTPKQIVSFWSRIIPQKESAYLFKMQSVLEKAGIDFNRFNFFQTLNEVDCSKNRMRSFSTLYYNRDMQILFSQAALNAEWTAIAPQSEEVILREAVCGDVAKREVIMQRTAHNRPSEQNKRPSG